MREITLQSLVALSSGDDRVNRLRPGSFGVTEFKLVTPGGKTSPSHRPAPFPAPTGPNDFCFAPEKEQLKIVYTLSNDFNVIREATIELFTRFAQKPLMSRKLTLEQLTSGEHRIPWDGKSTGTTPQFPDGYVTVEFSPYKLKLTLKGEGISESPTAWTYFHVLVKDITLELGDRKSLSLQRDKLLHDTLRGHLPAPGSTLQVKLLSNLFKTSSAEMSDNTAFTQYAAEWGTGPNLPLFAKVSLQDSQGAKVDAPKALGNVRFLWDWEDVTEDTSRHHPKAKTYLDLTLDYDKATTEPKGDNAPRQHGGKRGNPAAVVFPAEAGYAPGATLREGVFPFKVEACATRGWAAYSQAWRQGALAGKTGVLFQPARMAGDAYKVTVHLAFERKAGGALVLDVKDDAPLPAAIKASTGILEIWRELHLVKYVKKKSTLPGFTVGDFQDYYEKAFIRMEDKSGASSNMSAQYNTRMAAAVRAQPNYVQTAIDNTVNQYAIADYAVHFRAYPDYKNALQTRFSLSAAALTAWLAGPGIAVNTSAKYHELCKAWAKDIVTAACDGYLSAAQGINILQFSGLYNLETAPGGVKLNGFAADFPSAGRKKCAFVQCAPPSSYAGGSFNRMEQTVTHEIGHHLFLPHAPFPATSVPDGSEADMHDKDWSNCMMSYDYSAERKFCGLCLLRLRGWDKNHLNKDGLLNKKP